MNRRGHGAETHNTRAEQGRVIHVAHLHLADEIVEDFFGNVKVTQKVVLREHVLHVVEELRQVLLPDVKTPIVENRMA